MILHLLLFFFSLVHFFVIALFYWGLRKKPRETSHYQPFISVVIALKNEEENLAALLEGLQNQDYSPDKYEILLIDNSSDDDTFNQLKSRVAGNLRFQVLTTKDYSSDLKYKKEAMMMGIENARGEIILSTDADCIVPPTWISSMATQYQEDVDMVIGFSEVMTDPTLFQKIQKLDFLMLMAAAKGALNLGFHWAGSGQNISFRKKAFYNCGGYDGLKTLKGGDDTLFIQKFAKINSGKILFSTHSGSQVKTRALKNFRSFMRQRIRWAFEANYTRKFNPLVFFISLAAFGSNSALLFYFFLTLANSNFGIYLFSLTLMKYLIENLLAIKAADLFGMTKILTIFPIWFILYPPYAFFLGLMSFVGKNVKWK
ncbi:MAG: glycosyltransferase [Candidatus Marinimicrobia bacterium]|nr:glycosyltransferase [Candidatus Neomarinimicrobiota bacterium]